MRVALAHDYLLRFGGAERVLQVLHEMFPDAPIYTLLWDESRMRQFFPNAKIRTSSLERAPGFLKKSPRRLLPFIPIAVEGMDFSGYDLVISSSSAFIKGIVTRSHSVHISYCHAPSRFLWEWTHEYLKERPPHIVVRPFVTLLLNYLRMWDVNAAARVDSFVANSQFTASRILKYYRAPARVVYPPVRAVMRAASHHAVPSGEFFLIVSQLVPAKKLDIAVQAFRKLEVPLVIIGDGPERDKLARLAGKSTVFMGRLGDEATDAFFAASSAFVFSGEDDFGIAPVEAMLHGKPVLALRRGGARETVVEGRTGEFFDAPDVETLADGVRRLRENIRAGKYDPESIRAHAEQYSKAAFIEGIQAAIRDAYEQGGVSLFESLPDGTIESGV